MSPRLRAVIPFDRPAMASTDPSPLSLKELGNAAFKAREHSKAAKHYQDALKLIRSDAKAADADLERACQLNLASCHLSLGEHGAAVRMALISLTQASASSVFSQRKPRS